MHTMPGVNPDQRTFLLFLLLFFSFMALVAPLPPFWIFGLGPPPFPENPFPFPGLCFLFR